MRAEYGQIGAGGAGIHEHSLARLQSEMSQLCCDIQDINMIQAVDRSMIMTQLGLLKGNAKSIGYPTVQMLVTAASQRAENLHLLVGVIACDSGGLLHDFSSADKPIGSMEGISIWNWRLKTCLRVFTSREGLGQA